MCSVHGSWRRTETGNLGWEVSGSENPRYDSLWIGFHYGLWGRSEIGNLSRSRRDANIIDFDCFWIRFAHGSWWRSEMGIWARRLWEVQIIYFEWFSFIFLDSPLILVGEPLIFLLLELFLVAFHWLSLFLAWYLLRFPRLSLACFFLSGTQRIKSFTVDSRQVTRLRLSLPCSSCQVPNGILHILSRQVRIPRFSLSWFL